MKTINEAPASDRAVAFSDNQRPDPSDATQDLIRFKVAVINALRSGDLDAYAKLAEITLLVMMGARGAHPSNDTMAQILGLKDTRTVRRVLSQLDGRWNRSDVPGVGVARVPRQELVLEITAAVQEYREGKLRFTTKKQLRVPLMQVIEGDLAQPPTSDAPHTSNAGGEPLASNAGGRSAPPTSNAPPPPTRNAGGKRQPPAFDAPSPPASNAPLTVEDRNRSSRESRSASTAGADLFQPGIVMPAVVRRIVDSGKVPTGSTAFQEAVQSALARGVPAHVIEADIRKAIAYAAADAGAREPLPSQILGKCTAFVERSRVPDDAPALQPYGSRAGHQAYAPSSSVGDGFSPMPDEPI